MDGGLVGAVAGIARDGGTMLERDRLPRDGVVTRSAAARIVLCGLGVACLAVVVPGVVEIDRLPVSGNVALLAAASVMIDRGVGDVARSAICKVRVIKADVGPVVGACMAVGTRIGDAEQWPGYRVGQEKPLGNPGDKPDIGRLKVVFTRTVGGVARQALVHLDVIVGDGLPVVGAVARGALVVVGMGYAPLGRVAGDAVGELGVVKCGDMPIVSADVARGTWI
jgi:hypothetical protein